MSTVSLAELGYLSEAEIEKKVDRITSLVELGFFVYPCWGSTPQGCCCGKKHGATSEWGKHPSRGASTNLATDITHVAETWWSTNPTDNVGANPKMMRAVVFDVDPRSDGHNSWERLLNDLGLSDPMTVTTLTGEYILSNNQPVRGRHYWFKLTSSAYFPGNLDHLGYRGIDVKHNGGVLMPPSRHASNVTYSWAERRSPLEIEMGTIPPSLLAKVRRESNQTSPRYVVGYRAPLTPESRAITDLLNEPIEEGARAVGIYRLTCRVASRLGVETDQKADIVKGLMLKFNQEMVRPPLDLGGSDRALSHIERAIRFVKESGHADASD